MFILHRTSSRISAIVPGTAIVPGRAIDHLPAHADDVAPSRARMAVVEVVEFRRVCVGLVGGTTESERFPSAAARHLVGYPVDGGYPSGGIGKV